MLKSFDYKKAGVNIDIADRAKSRIKALVKKTFNKGVLSEIGKFGGFFAVNPRKYRNPVFVSSVDGVGTKLKVACMMNKFDTVGIDLVNHCVNDILVHGAKPLFFLDYIAMAKTTPGKIADIVKGLVTACKKEKCAIIGGETAQMPDVYRDNDFDLVGLIVGIVERYEIIDGRKIKTGDKIIGFPSNGLHTNGYTLARKLFFNKAKYKINTYLPELKTTVGKELLKPHKSYTKVVFKLIDKFNIKGLVHITGGGFLDNIPRVLPEELAVVISKNTFKILPVFNLIKKLGNLHNKEMFRTFNMGIGMVAIVSKKDCKKVMEHLKRINEPAYEIGVVIKKTRKLDKINII